MNCRLCRLYSFYEWIVPNWNLGFSRSSREQLSTTVLDSVRVRGEEGDLPLAYRIEAFSVV